MRPVKVCMSIDKAFFLLIEPAWEIPAKGVCNMTNVVAWRVRGGRQGGREKAAPIKETGTTYPST